jgi:proliferating cell nuclear antigen
MTTHDTVVDVSKYRMYVKSIQGGAIRTLFEVMKEVIHDVSMCFDSTGIKLITMDGSRCALIHLRLEASRFELFHCPGTFLAGVNMNSVFKLVRTTGTHDTITFYASHNVTNELGIKISNSDKNSVTDFSLKLLDVDSEDIRLPDVEFNSIITLPSAYFQRLCRDMINIGTTMEISSSPDGTLKISCEGDFARQETIIGEATDGMNVSSRTGAEICGRFALKFLVLFCRASSLCSTVELLLKQNFPLIMKFNVASLGEVRFVLAPRMDD